MRNACQSGRASSRSTLRSTGRMLAQWVTALTALAVVSLVAVAPAGAASLSARPPAFTLRARQVAGADARPGPVVLTAQATGAVSVGLQVTFSVRVTQFEYAPLLQIGTATTGASGEASVSYQPTWNGPQEFVASAQSPSGGQLAPASITISARATTGFTGTVEASRPDGAIGRWVVVGLLILVAGVWIALIAVVVRVYLTMRTGPA